MENDKTEKKRSNQKLYAHLQLLRRFFKVFFSGFDDDTYVHTQSVVRNQTEIASKSGGGKLNRSSFFGGFRDTPLAHQQFFWLEQFVVDNSFYMPVPGKLFLFYE